MNGLTSLELMNIYRLINKLCCTACVSNTGSQSLGAKQDLYKIKWHLEDAINKCPNFGQEEQDWLRDQEQKRS